MEASIEAWTGAGYTGVNGPPGPTDFTIPAGVPPRVRGIGDVWVDNSQTLLSWDVNWLTPVLLNGWLNYGGVHQTARYRKLLSGMVTMEGLVKSGTIGSTVFTLPPGYRPMEGKFIGVMFGETNPTRIDILSNGSVIIVNGTAGYVALNFSFWPDA